MAVDAPPPLGEKYLKAIAEVTDETVNHVISSCSHADHIVAASMYPAGAESAKPENSRLKISRLQHQPSSIGCGPGSAPVIGTPKAHPSNRSRGYTPPGIGRRTYRDYPCGRVG